jgi:multidrug efflux pump subunit AcrA (membrane-fusion protein)
MQVVQFLDNKVFGASVTHTRFFVCRFLWLLSPFVFSPTPVSAQGQPFAFAQPLECVINPSIVADLGSGAPGVLDRVRVERSDFIKVGDVVAELESGVEMAALELARARAAGLDSQMNTALGQGWKARLSDVGDRQALAELELQYAQESLKRRTIRSPIEGVVMKRFKVAGEHVEDQPVVRVAQINPLHVEVTVPVERLGAVHQGMQAMVWTEAAGDTKWQATVDRIDRIADTNSGTYGVRLSMNNPDHLVPVGLRCRVHFVPETTADLGVPGSSTAVAVDDAAQQQGLGSSTSVAKSTPATQSSKEPSDLAPIEPGAVSLCGWLGPYESVRAAKVAARPLRVDGVDVRVLERPGQKMVGFKIVSPPQYSRADLKAYLNRLRNAGMSDFIPLSKKQGARRIALGVYHSRGPAEERVKELEAKGFEVEIGPWYKQKEMHWLLVKGDTSLLDPKVAQKLANGDGENPAPGLCDRVASR